MPDYIRHDPITGRITERWISVDPSKIAGYDNVLQVSREVAEGITKFHIVENGVVRLMTQSEKDTLLAEEAQTALDAENARIADIDDKVSKARTTDFPMAKVDTAIDTIANLADAKLFLKRMCRYLAKRL